MSERLTFIVHKYMMIIGNSYIKAFLPAKTIVTLCEIKSSPYSISSHYKHHSDNQTREVCVYNHSIKPIKLKDPRTPN